MQLHHRLRFGFGRHLPVLLQTQASECGLACLAMIASFHGRGTDLAEMRSHHAVSLKGATLAQLSGIAESLGLTPRPLRLEMDELGRLELPAVLHWDLNHFVVLKAVRGGVIELHDPASGALHLSMAEAGERFTGVAMELVPNFDFRRRPAPEPIPLRQIVGKVTGLRRGLLQSFALATALEALSLLLPIVTEWITDDAIVTGDTSFLNILGASAIAIALTSTALTAMRSWVGLYIGTHFNLQWMANVMGHLLRLPIDFFERRHLGDIVSRFGTVNTITQTLTSATVEIGLDGLMATGTGTGTGVMMLVYSPHLCAITAAAVAIYAGLRWARVSAVRLAASGAMVKQAKEQTYFLETLRGVRAIRLFSREAERRTAWLNLWVDSTNAALVSQKLSLLFNTSWSVLSALERSGVLWLGAYQVINHRMSLGMLMAFLSFKEQFSARAVALVDRIVDFKVLAISSQRLADIVMTPPEEPFHDPSARAPLKGHDLQLEKVSFRYGKDERPILDAVDVRIHAGECVAIVGASGCGKTTLLKLLLGVLQPTGGTVRFGGVPLARIGLRHYRQFIGTVMQDDHLFAGSILDNVCFLDPKPDLERVLECMRLASIQAEVLEMPMGLHTLVGDMGSVLSGGQKQRVLLARALYPRPKVLVLDEATSHLDLGHEMRISDALASLHMTRIIIAHRPQTIAIAQRVLRLERGRLVQVAFSAGVTEPRPSEVVDPELPTASVQKLA